jgi:hypothetical protein
MARGQAWGPALRIVAIGAVAALLGGCVTDPGPYSTYAKAGSWRIDKQVDRVTAQPVAGAAALTPTSWNTNEIGARPASVQLTCFENKPIARFAFGFKIGSDKNTSFGYRFDDKPGRDNVESRVLLGYQVLVIEDKAALAQFLGDLVGSNVLYVRIRSLNSGNTTAEFKVDGADAALQAAYVDCPLPLAPPSRRTS